MTGTITLAEAAGSGGVAVSLMSSNTAAATVPSSVTVSEGNTTATFDVDTEALTQPVDVTIRASYNNVIRTALLTIVPSLETVTLEIVSLESDVVGDFDATGMVTLSAAAPSGGIVVTLGGSRTGLATVPASVTVAQGETTAAFTITTVRPLSTSDVLVTAQYDGLVRTALLKIYSNWELRRPPDMTTESLRTGRARSWRRGVGRNSVSISAPTSTPAARRNVTAQTEDPEQRYYFYTPELNLLAETQLTTSATPAVEWEYVWFGGQPVAQIETATNTIAWYFNDHLGTPILQTDASANVIWRIEREPFGKIFKVRAGAERHQPLAFPGQEEEGGETSYNIFRWYRSWWGRYTQADPIGLAAGTNLYLYVDAGPISASDALGLAKGPSIREMECCDLKDEIDNISLELGRRVGEEARMQRLLREHVIDRSAMKNLKEYLGHREQFKGKQNRLKKLLKAWNRKGCGDPPDGAGWVGINFPSIAYIYDIWKETIVAEWQDFNWWLGGLGLDACGCE